MTDRQEQIAELYYRSNSVQYGEFELSIHRDFPDLPLSPWYLHYPKPNEPGAELLPQLHDLIGAEFYDMLIEYDPDFEPPRITGLPRGAWPLGDALARRYKRYDKNLIKFDKIQHADGRTEFTAPVGEYEIGEELVECEDHVSGARNNRLFVAHARRYGFVVRKLLAVVDRQQGGLENLAAEGVDMMAIFTADALLRYGLAARHLMQNQFDEIQAYREANQFSLHGLAALQVQK
jgi:orotate phosphoribosyltransferase